MSIQNGQELTELNSQLAILRQDMDKYKKTVKAERSEEREVKNQLQVELSDLKIKIAGFEYELSQKDKAIKDFKSNEELMITENRELSKFVQEYTEQKEKEICDLKNSHTQEITQLNSKIQQLEDGLTDVVRTGQQKALESEQTLNSIKLVQTEVIEKLTQENRRLSNNLDEVQRKLRVTEEDSRTKGDENSQLRSRLSTLASESAQLTKNLQDIQAELERVNELITAAEASIKEKDRQINTMSLERSEMHQSLLRSQEKQEELERLIKSLSTQKAASASLETENMQLRSHLDSANRELSALRVKTSQSQAIVITSSPQLGMSASNGSFAPVYQQPVQDGLVRREVEELRKQVQSSVSQVVSLQQQLNQKQIELDTTRAEHSVANSKLANLNSHEALHSQRLFSMEEKVRHLQSELVRKTQECETYKSQALDLRATAEELVDEFKESQMLSTSWKSQQEEAKVLAKELQEARAKHEEDLKELKKRTEHNRKLAEAFDKQRGELFKAQEQQKESQVELSVLREELAKLKSKPPKADKPEPKKSTDLKKTAK